MPKLIESPLAMLPPGTILPYSGGTVPAGFLLCDGSAVSRTTYADLFQSLSTTHGQGDGSTTFNLPDFRGQFLRGAIPSAINSISGSGTASSNNATFTSHGLNRTGIKVRLSSGTLSGLTTSTTYYAIVVDANTLAFATSQANAISGTKIAISGTNSGVIRQWEDPDNRASSTVGAVSTGVGSQQDHQLGSHKHDSGVNADNTGGGACAAVWNNCDNNGAQYQTGFTGGNETRPQNIAVNYIVKF